MSKKSKVSVMFDMLMGASCSKRVVYDEYCRLCKEHDFQPAGLDQFQALETADNAVRDFVQGTAVTEADLVYLSLLFNGAFGASDIDTSERAKVLSERSEA